MGRPTKEQLCIVGPENLGLDLAGFTNHSRAGIRSFRNNK